MKPHRFAQLAPGALSIAMLMFPVSSVAERSTETVGMRDLRVARTALAEGQWREGLDIYERLLESPIASDPKVRSEALFNTALILLATDPEGAAADTAIERLGALAARRGHGKELEVAALQAVLVAVREERASVTELSETLREERLAAAEASQRAALDLAARDSSLARCEEVNEAQRKRNRRLNRKARSLEEQVETQRAMIAQRDADIDLLTSQLEGTHQDQTKILKAIIEKNSELRLLESQLRTTRIALQKKEKELSEQEDELRKREEAIREVTERILEKDEPDR